METKSLDSLLQELWAIQHTPSKYTNISFEDILLEAFEVAYPSEQAPSEGFNPNKPTEVSDVRHYLYAFPMLVTMLTSRAEVEGSGITSEADISSQVKDEGVQIYSDANISGSRTLGVSASKEAFKDLGKHLNLVAQLASSQKSHTQIDTLFHHDKPITELGVELKARMSQEHDRPITENMSSQVKKSVIFQDVSSKASEKVPTQELYGSAGVLEIKKGKEHSANTNSKPQYWVGKASFEEPVFEKVSFPSAFTWSEEELHGNFNTRFGYDSVSRMKFSAFMNVEEAVAEESSYTLDVKGSSKTFQNNTLVPNDGEGWEHLYKKGNDEVEKDTNLGKEEKGAELLLEETISNIRVNEEGLQKVERVEKPQTQHIYEAKHLSVRLEEGSVRLVLTGDRLRLTINLREDLYMQPTAFEVQKLVQSLQSLGLNLELLKLNGSSLYSSDHRHGTKREDREKTYQLSLPEFTEEATKGFSLYL